LHLWCSNAPSTAAAGIAADAIDPVIGDRIRESVDASKSSRARRSGAN
jgi:hypothetical protein